MTEARPEVVLLPALGLDASMYAPLATALAPHADVVALDYPGFGAEPPIALPDLAALADHLAASMPRAPAILGGLSLGGTLALSIAERVKPRSLLLFAPGGLRVAAARRTAIEESMTAGTAEDFARRSLGLDAEDFALSRFREHFDAPGPHVGAYYTHLRERVWANAPARAELYRTLLLAALDVDLEDHLRANALPVDLVWGEADRVFSTRTRRRYTDTLARHALHVLPGVGHFAPLEAPDAVAHIVFSRLAR